MDFHTSRDSICDSGTIPSVVGRCGEWSDSHSVLLTGSELGAVLSFAGYGIGR